MTKTAPVEELVIMKTIYFKGDDGLCYCHYVKQDGQVIHLEVLERWPFAEIGDKP